MDSVQRALSQFDITLRKKKDQWETQQAKSDKEKAISVGRTFPILPPEDAFIFTALPEALTPEQQRGIAGICTLLLRAFVDDTLNKIRKTNDPALKRAVNQSLTKWTQGMLKVISSGLALDEAEKKRIRRIIEGHVNPGDIDSDDFSLGNFIREATENTDASADIVKDMYDSGILKQAQAETDTKMDKVLKSIDVRHHILLQLILISVVETKSYASFTRVYFQRLTESLALPDDEPTLAYLECQVALQLRLQQEDKNEGNGKGGMSHIRNRFNYLKLATEAQEKRVKEGKMGRKTKIALTAVGGAVALGLTGGLAAPVLASVLGGWGLGAIASTGLITTVFAGVGAKSAANRMSRRTQEVEEFALEDITVNDMSLHATLCVSGWLKTKDQITSPWLVPLGDNLLAGDVFALRWETESNKALGAGINEFAKKAALGFAKKEIIKRTFLAGLMAAMWPVALLKIGYLIDNPFQLALVRAEKTGILLADFLRSRPFGTRPVSLVGYSMGARAIYYCLKSLADTDNDDNLPPLTDLIEDIALIGAPIAPSAEDWRIVQTVVGGRLINCYSPRDWVLAFMFRGLNAKYGRIAGLHSAKGDDFEAGFNGLKKSLNTIRSTTSSRDPSPGRQAPLAKPVSNRKKDMEKDELIDLLSGVDDDPREIDALELEADMANSSLREKYSETDSYSGERNLTSEWDDLESTYVNKKGIEEEIPEFNEKAPPMPPRPTSKPASGTATPTSMPVAPTPPPPQVLAELRDLRVEDYDVSDIIEKHTDYGEEKRMAAIMLRLGWVGVKELKMSLGDINEPAPDLLFAEEAAM